MRTVKLGLALLVGLLASGCDPYLYPGTWVPKADNQHNLAEMVSDQQDLTHGRGSSVARGNAAVPAIDRLVNDNTKKLINNDVSTVGAQSASQ